MRPIALPVVLALTAIVPLGTPVGARAEPIHDLADGGRYQLMEINDKIVRLDTKTGVFDLCHMEADDWTCVTTRDQRAEFESKIATLTRRVEKLEKVQTLATARPAQAATVATAPLPAPAPTPAPAAVPAPMTATAPTPSPAPVAAQPSQTSSEFEQVAGIVPTVEVGRTPGAPMVIVPAAPEAEKPGLIKRLTGMLPDLDW